MLFQVVQQTVEHHMVMRSPFAETFGKREIFIRNDVVYSCLDQEERMLVKSASPP